MGVKFTRDKYEGNFASKSAGFYAKGVEKWQQLQIMANIS